VLKRQGKYDEALEHMEQAVATFEQVLGPDHPDLALSVNSLGVLFYEQKKYTPARHHYLRAQSIWNQALGSNHRYAAMVENNLGEIAIAQKNFTQALSHCQNALQIGKKQLPARHPIHAYHLNCVANSLLGMGQPVEAIAPLEQALTLQIAPNDPSVRATLQFALARALRQSGRDQPRAQKLAQQALQGFTSAGEHRQDNVTEIKQWLKNR